MPVSQVVYNEQKRRLYLPFECRVFFKGKQIKINIQSGFTWNGASIPRLFWGLFYSPNHWKLEVPALIHDYLYSKFSINKINRKESDEIFYQLLIEYNVPKIKAFIMYMAVRIFGASHFVQNKISLYQSI